MAAVLLLLLLLLIIGQCSAQCGDCNNVSQLCVNDTCVDSCNDTCANVCMLSLCYCDYAYGGPSCTLPVTSSAAWQALRWGVGAALLGILMVLCVLEGVVFALHNWPLGLNKLPIVAALALSAAACIVRMLYYIVDPFGWNNVFALCTINVLDYVSLACVGCAYLLLVVLWLHIAQITAMSKSSSLSKLITVVRIACVVAISCVLVLMIAASCVFCILDGITGDLIFFIPFVILLGLGAIVCCISCIYIITKLVQFKGAYQKSQQLRLKKFLVFIVLSACAVVLLIAANISIFLFDLTPFTIGQPTYEGLFLWIEWLEGVSVIVVVCSVLVLGFTESGKDSGHGSSGSTQESVGTPLLSTATGSE